MILQVAAPRILKHNRSLWPHADPAVVIVSISVVSVILVVILVATGYFFVRNNSTAEKRQPMIPTVRSRM